VALQRPEPLALKEVSDPSLLTGAVGIGLALLAATTPVEPMWDRILLLDLPRRQVRDITP